MTDHSLRLGDASLPTFPDLPSSFSDRLSRSTSASVRLGHPCVCAFCSWHEIGIARLQALKDRAEMPPNIDLWSVSHLSGFTQRFSRYHFDADFRILA